MFFYGSKPFRSEPPVLTIESSALVSRSCKLHTNIFFDVTSGRPKVTIGIRATENLLVVDLDKEA